MMRFFANTPPPKPLLNSPVVLALLFKISQFWIVNEDELSMPPPLFASLSVILTFSSVKSPLFNIPPP